MNERAEVIRRGMRASLATSRLDLTAFQPNDAEELHEIFADPHTHTIGSGPFHDIEETRTWIERRRVCHRDLGLCWYALRDRPSRRLVGNCGIFIGRTGATEPEIGYEIRYDSQRRGYATEAAAAVVAECARTGLRRMWATVRPTNAASLQVLNHIGMIHDRWETDEKGILDYLSRVP